MPSPVSNTGLERFLAGAELVIANPKEGEVVVDEPFEECIGFGDLIRRHRRPVGFELGDHVLDTFQHRPPVGDTEADVGEHPLDGRHDVSAAGLVVDRLEMDVDHAFAQRSGSRLGILEGDEAAGIVAHDGQNGMYDEAHIDAAVGELRQHRVEQERHVVIDDLQHRSSRAAPGLAAGPTVSRRMFATPGLRTASRDQASAASSASWRGS